MLSVDSVWLVKGVTTHARFKPKENKFCYRHDGLLFNILSDKNWSLLNKISNLLPIKIKNSDYLFGKNEEIIHQLRRFLTQANYDSDFTTCFLFTVPRFFNFAFNPVNFYWGFNDKKLVFFIAEVNNTYEERYVYFSSEARYFTWVKSFFVSPFFPAKGEYKVFQKIDSNFVYVAFNYYFEQSRVFFADFKGYLEELKSPLKVGVFIAKNPLSFGFTLLKIYLQGLKLWSLKMLKVQPKPQPRGIVYSRPYAWLDGWCFNRALEALNKAKKGILKMRVANEVYTFGNKEEGYEAELNVNDYSFFRKLVFGGSVGFGDSYVDGFWSSDDPAKVVAFLLNNWDFFGSHGGYFFRLVNFLLHLKNSNFITVSKKNISFHYDKPVEFFRLFLDPTLTYSCAFFENTHDLEQAQLKKIDSIIEEIELKSSDVILEIGSGFGSFALRAVKKTGCKVVTITLSKVQYEYLQRVINEQGLNDYVTVLLTDYRNIEGRFDKVVSVEMIEAVGDMFLSTYFKKIDSVLKPGGVVSIQAIVYPDYDYKSYLKRADWIQLRVFPGSFLPSLLAIHKAIEGTRLCLDFCYNRAQDYAKTLRLWRSNLYENREQVLQFFTEREFRCWEFYLASCEAEFATSWLRLLRMRFSRPNERVFKM